MAITKRDIFPGVLKKPGGHGGERLDYGYGEPGGNLDAETRGKDG